MVRFIHSQNHHQLSHKSRSQITQLQTIVQKPNQKSSNLKRKNLKNNQTQKRINNTQKEKNVFHRLAQYITSIVTNFSS